MGSATLVFAIIVVGGVTRLTESGLSITEWKPITGVVPPLTQEEWESEFAKYKETPEFKLCVHHLSYILLLNTNWRRLNHSITIEDFKFIFFWEWGHRVLGRLIGVAFVGPLAYFALRKKIDGRMTRRLFGLGLLIGAQGALGWYMVKSGLDNKHLEDGSVPRVSQYRLAAHLGTAFLLYLGMFGTGLSVIKDWKYARGGPWSGSTTGDINKILSNPAVKRIKVASWALMGLVFVTAMSGMCYKQPLTFLCLL